MEETQKNNKLIRVIVGALIAFFALGCVYLGGIALFVFLLAVIFFGSKEYVEILKHKGFHTSFSMTCVSSLVFALLIFFNRFDFIPCVLTFAVIGSFLVVLFMGRQPYIANVATTALGIMYGGWLPCHLLLIRQMGSKGVHVFTPGLNEGLYLLTFTFIVVIATDVGAYFFGSRFGKHKLAEIISPKKTIEGAVFGGVFAIIAGVVFAVLTNKILIWDAIFGGLLVTVAAQLGDLSESLIKRDAGVKDSSNVIPGHGGFMDRVDSYVFALPVAYYFFAKLPFMKSVILNVVNYISSVGHVYFG